MICWTVRLIDLPTFSVRYSFHVRNMGLSLLCKLDTHLPVPCITDNTDPDVT